MDPFKPFDGRHHPPSSPPPTSELLEARAALKRTVAYMREMEKDLATKNAEISTPEEQKMALAFELEEAKSALAGAQATAVFFRTKLLAKRPREPGLIDPEEKTRSCRSSRLLSRPLRLQGPHVIQHDAGTSKEVGSRALLA